MNSTRAVAVMIQAVSPALSCGAASWPNALIGQSTKAKDASETRRNRGATLNMTESSLNDCWFIAQQPITARAGWLYGEETSFNRKMPNSAPTKASAYFMGKLPGVQQPRPRRSSGNGRAVRISGW